MPSGSLIGDSQKVSVSNSLVTYFWAGANDTNAPDATNIENGTYGVSQDGGATGVIYWVVNGSWVSTTATVPQFHGV